MDIEALPTSEELYPDGKVILNESFRHNKNLIGYNATVAGKEIGTIELLYLPDKKEVQVDWVYVTQEKKGYGKQMYRQVPTLPLPDGSDFTESGYRFVSSPDINWESNGLWESLAKNGEARLLDNGQYEFVIQVPEN